LDDFEEEIVDASSAEGIIDAFDAVAADAVAQRPEVVGFLEGLRDLARQASNSSRPLPFVLGGGFAGSSSVRCFRLNNQSVGVASRVQTRFFVSG
jgi:hypothetical protein